MVFFVAPKSLAETRGDIARRLIFANYEAVSPKILIVSCLNSGGHATRTSEMVPMLVGRTVICRNEQQLCSLLAHSCNTASGIFLRSIRNRKPSRVVTGANADCLIKSQRLSCCSRWATERDGKLHEGGSEGRNVAFGRVMQATRVMDRAATRGMTINGFIAATLALEP